MHVVDNKEIHKQPVSGLSGLQILLETILF